MVEHMLNVDVINQAVQLSHHSRAWRVHLVVKFPSDQPVLALVVDTVCSVTVVPGRAL